MDAGIFLVLAFLAIGAILTIRFAIVETRPQPPNDENLEEWKKKNDL